MRCLHPVNCQLHTPVKCQLYLFVFRSALGFSFGKPLHLWSVGTSSRVGDGVQNGLNNQELEV